MEFWYTEQHTPDVRLSIRVNRQLYSGQSEFQRIDVFESPEFGRFLTLDGYMMLTEKDEFIYHEMITHVPMCVHPEAENILVIGGGDGGTVRELLRYPSIRHIDLVEIDEMVVDVCREYLPSTASCLSDERVHIHYETALRAQTHRHIRPHYCGLDGSIWTGGRSFHEGVLRELLQGTQRERHHDQSA